MDGGGEVTLAFPLSSLGAVKDVCCPATRSSLARGSGDTRRWHVAAVAVGGIDLGV